MKNKNAKIIISMSVIIVLAILIIVALQNNNILNKQQNQQLADVGYTTQIGDKTYNITDKIENDIVPTLSAGMIPIKQDGEYWTIVDRQDASWCSYANGIPAYMMLNDGKYQSEEYYQMPDTKQLAKAGTQINKNSTDLGSIYMWVPRYAYNENGDIIYIKQESSVAGTWKMPDVFSYKTEKEDYALAGIWAECGETAELTNKIAEMNTQDSQYGFISNTKANAMTEDEQETVQRIVENLNVLVGETSSRQQIDDISNLNHSVIHIINTNILEPIKAIGILNSQEERIEISIKSSINEIDKVLDIKGYELTLQDEKYTQSTKDIAPPYIVVDNDGNQKEVKFDNVLFINSAKELSKFRNKVNAGNNFAGVTVIQVSDINMSSECYDGKSWEPIGTGNVFFSGIYDGGYHTISNLYINSDKYFDLGMFTQTNKSSVIKRLILDNIYIQNTYNGESKTDINGNFYTSCGGIVGYGFGTIEQCGIESGNIRIVNAFRYFGTWKGGLLGGIVGRNSGTVNECYNKANIYQQNKNENYNAAMTGGITGTAITNSVITNSYNKGNISISSYYAVDGGMIGDKWTYNGIIVKNCYNTGDLTIDSSSSYKYKGGMVGRHEGNSLTITKGYCLTDATYGATLTNSNTLKGYASTLGSSYLPDEYEINEGYPILKWELEAKKILAKAYINTDEGKIKIEIMHHKNDIVKVENEKGEILDKISDELYEETLTLGNHIYKITDSKGNTKVIEYNLKEKLNVIYDTNTKSVEITTFYGSQIAEVTNQNGNKLNITNNKAYGTLGNTASKYTVTDINGNTFESEINAIKINNEVLNYNKVAVVGNNKKQTTVKQGLDYLVDNGYTQNVALLLMEGYYDTKDIHNQYSYSIDYKYSGMDISIVADEPGLVKCTSGEMSMSQGDYNQYSLMLKFYGIVFTETYYGDGGGMTLNQDNNTKEYYNCVFKAPMGGWNGEVASSAANVYNCLFLGGKNNCYDSYGIKGYTENTASKNSIISPRYGDKATCLYNVTVDSEYNITSDGWQNTGTGFNPDGTQANIGVYGGKYAWNKDSDKLDITYNTNTKQVEIKIKDNIQISKIIDNVGNELSIKDNKAYGSLGNSGTKYIVIDENGNVLKRNINKIKINNEILEYNKVVIVGNNKTQTTIKQGLDYLVDNGYKNNVAMLIMNGSYSTSDVNNGSSYNVNSKYNGIDISVIADTPGEVKCTSGEMAMTEINSSYGFSAKFYGMIFTSTYYGSGGGMTLNQDAKLKEYYNCVFCAPIGGYNGTISSCTANVYNCLFLGGKNNCYDSYGIKGYTENTASKNSIISPRYGDKATCLYNITVDSEYNITSDGWQNTGTGENPDGTVANIGVYGGKYAWSQIKINTDNDNKIITVDVSGDYGNNFAYARYINKAGITIEKTFSNKTVSITDAKEEEETIIYLVTNDGRTIEVIAGFSLNIDLHNAKYITSGNKMIENEDGSLGIQCPSGGWLAYYTFLDGVDLKKYKTVEITFSFTAGYEFGIAFCENNDTNNTGKIITIADVHSYNGYRNSVPKTTFTAEIPQDWDTVYLAMAPSSFSAILTIYDIKFSM